MTLGRITAVSLIMLSAVLLAGCGNLPKYSAYSAIDTKDKATLTAVAEKEPWVLTDLSGDGYNALHYAALKSSNSIIEYLIDKGLDVNDVALYGVTPLVLAIRRNSKTAIELLLDRGARIDQVHRFAASPLVEAIDAETGWTTNKLLMLGADVNEVDHVGRTPLSMAALKGDRSLLKRLLESGADVNYQNASGWRPVHFAALRGDITSVRLLLERGALSSPIATAVPELEDLVASATTCAVAQEMVVDAASSGRQSKLALCREEYEKRALDAFEERINTVQKTITMTHVGNAMSAVVGAVAAQAQARTNTVITPSGRVVGVGVAPYTVSSTSELSSQAAYFQELKKLFVAKLAMLEH